MFCGRTKHLNKHLISTGRSGYGHRGSRGCNEEKICPAAVLATEQIDIVTANALIN